MPRSGVAARLRLRAAALDLFAAQGWDRTTTAQIAATAGVTERTYFRHYADKREVLFDGEGELIEAMTAAVREAVDGTDPLQMVLAAYRAAIPLVVAGRSEAERRRRVIATAPALQERAHTKLASLQNALVTALADRDIPEPLARLTTRLGAAAFEQATTWWTADPELDLTTCLSKAMQEIRALVEAVR